MRRVTETEANCRYSDSLIGTLIGTGAAMPAIALIILTLDERTARMPEMAGMNEVLLQATWRSG